MIAKPSRPEWDALLVSEPVDVMLEGLYTSGVLKAVFPELHSLVGFGGGNAGHKDLWAHTKTVVKQTEPRPILRWAALFHDCGKPKCFSRQEGEISFHGHEIVSAHMFRTAAHRSKLFQTNEIDRISMIIRLLGNVEAYSSEWSDSAVRRLGRDLGELARDVFAVARADCTSQSAARRRAVRAKCDALQERMTRLIAADATPPLLPKGLGIAVMRYLGFERAATVEQRKTIKHCINALKAMVEAGELPRSADHGTYLAVMPKVLAKR